MTTMTKTARFTTKKAADKFIEEVRSNGGTVLFVGKRQTYVAKAWQKPAYEFLVDYIDAE